VSAGVVWLRGSSSARLVVSLLFFFGPCSFGQYSGYCPSRIEPVSSNREHVYPLYGFHDRVHRIITLMTTIRFLRAYSCDSSTSFIICAALGYTFPRSNRPGRTFGLVVLQANPYLFLSAPERWSPMGWRLSTRGLEHVILRISSVDRATQLRGTTSSIPREQDG